MTTHTISCASGAQLDLQDPASWDGRISDMAVGLSHVCRWAGQVRFFYSVAEHSLLVYQLMRIAHPADDQLALAALFHDGHEAFYGDVPSPLKPLLGPPYVAMCAAFDAELCQRLDLPVGIFKDPRVKACDTQALHIEGCRLAAPGVWPPAALPQGVLFSAPGGPAGARVAFEETAAKLGVPAVLTR